MQLEPIQLIFPAIAVAVLAFFIVAIKLSQVRSANGVRAPERYDDRETVQQHMPVEDVRGCFAVLTDGSMVGYMSYPLRGESLATQVGKMSSAMLDSEVISGIQQPFSLLLYPEKASDTRQTVLIDAAVTRERDAMFNSKSTAESEMHRARMAQLMGWMREASSSKNSKGTRIKRNAWLAVRFPAGIEEKLALRTMDAICRSVERITGIPARLVDEAEIRHMCSLWFRPSTPVEVGGRAASPIPPMPRIEAGRR